MAPAMAKVFAVLCVALLVAHVDGARRLNSLGGLRATTTPLDLTTTALPADEYSELEAAPAPVDEYNYNNAEDSNTTTTTTPEFTDVDGFLVSDPATFADLTNSANEYSTLTEDESADPAELADEDSTSGGHLVPGPSVPISSAYPGAGVGPQGSDPQDSSTPSYVFDATTDNAASVYPTPTQEEGSYAALPEDFEFSDAPPIPQDASDESLEWEADQPGN